MPLRPHPDHARSEAAARRLLPYSISWSGETYRYVKEQYAGKDDVVSGLGSQRAGGRWNAPGTFPAVYGSLEPETALKEMLTQAARYGIPFAALLPRVLIAVTASLSQVLDLTDAKIRRRLRVSRQRMQAERWWERQDAGEEALTQAIGRAAHVIGFEGLLVPCAADARAVNLVVFPRNLTSESRLTGSHIVGRYRPDETV
jgi:RES domain-containing protein